MAIVNIQYIYNQGEIFSICVANESSTSYKLVLKKDFTGNFDVLLTKALLVGTPFLILPHRYWSLCSHATALSAFHGHLFAQSSTHALYTAGGLLGQRPMHAESDPPGQPLGPGLGPGLVPVVLPISPERISEKMTFELGWSFSNVEGTPESSEHRPLLSPGWVPPGGSVASNQIMLTA